MYYIRPQLWVATVEFGSHNSALCWRRGQLVQGNQVIQPFHHYMDELSRYIQTYKPSGIKETAKTKTARIRYSARKNAMAPSAILLPMDCILSFPSFCLPIQEVFQKANAMAITPDNITNKI